MNSHSPVIHVSAGILIQANGQVLLTQRPPDKPWEGYWEFPGGKIEQGESPASALKRELHEELGIHILNAYPWLNFEYHYPDRRVHLHFFRVTNWENEPIGNEGQNLSWEYPNQAGISPLLPANEKLMMHLSLPDVYAITCAEKMGVTVFMDKLETALEKGIRLIQIRESGMQDDNYQAFTRKLIARAHYYNARVLVNGNENLARLTGADGIHLPSQQLMQCRKRPDFSLCAASCHNLEELKKAADLDMDFAVLSPVQPTPSHPGEPTLGWETFASLCSKIPLPVYSLGGMKHNSLQMAMKHRAQGIAMLRGAWN